MDHQEVERLSGLHYQLAKPDLFNTTPKESELKEKLESDMEAVLEQREENAVNRFRLKAEFGVKPLDNGEYYALIDVFVDEIKVSGDVEQSTEEDYSKGELLHTDLLYKFNGANIQNPYLVEDEDVIWVPDLEEFVRDVNKLDVEKEKIGWSFNPEKYSQV